MKVGPGSLGEEVPQVEVKSNELSSSGWRVLKTPTSSPWPPSCPASTPSAWWSSSSLSPAGWSGSSWLGMWARWTWRPHLLMAWWSAGEHLDPWFGRLLSICAGMVFLSCKLYPDRLASKDYLKYSKQEEKAGGWHVPATTCEEETQDPGAGAEVQEPHDWGWVLCPSLQQPLCIVATRSKVAFLGKRCFLYFHSKICI